MKASQIDKMFDENKEDILEYFDTSRIRKINLESKKINLELPLWMIQRLEEEAQHIGVTPEAIIKVWLAQKLQLQ